jgi:hypothetical protein
MIEREFQYPECAKSVGSSHGDLRFVVQPSTLRHRERYSGSRAKRLSTSRRHWASIACCRSTSRPTILSVTTSGLEPLSDFLRAAQAASCWASTKAFPPSRLRHTNLISTLSSSPFSPRNNFSYGQVSSQIGLSISWEACRSRPPTPPDQKPSARYSCTNFAVPRAIKGATRSGSNNDIARELIGVFPLVRRAGWDDEDITLRDRDILSPGRGCAGATLAVALTDGPALPIRDLAPKLHVALAFEDVVNLCHVIVIFHRR